MPLPLYRILSRLLFPPTPPPPPLHTQFNVTPFILPPPSPIHYNPCYFFSPVDPMDPFSRPGTMTNDTHIRQPSPGPTQLPGLTEAMPQSHSPIWLGCATYKNIGVQTLRSIGVGRSGVKQKLLLLLLLICYLVRKSTLIPNTKLLIV